VLLVIDGLLGPSEQDAKIMQAVLEGHKGVILVVNKADEGQKIPEFKKIVHEQIQKTFHFFDDVLVTFISAKNGNGLEELMEQIEELDKKRHFRVSTSDLNDFFFETIRKAPAPVWGTTNVKFYYLTQTFQKPPAFIAFANHPDGVTNSYRRFLIKHLKEKFDLWGIPIRIFCMKSRRSGSSSEKGQ
jgi:GTP-binding protein